MGRHTNRDAVDASDLRTRLARTEARYRTLVERIPAILYEDVPREDGDLLATYVAPQIKTILGIDPEVYLDPNRDVWEDHLHPDDRDRAVKEYKSALAAGAPLVQEYRMVRDDGQVVWIRDEYTIVKDDRGNVVCVQGVMFDITERKEAEAAVARQVDLLRRVDAIGREFTNLVLRGSSTQAILKSLAGIVPGVVVLEDAAHQVVEYDPGDLDPDELLQTWDTHSRTGHDSKGTGVQVEPGCMWISIDLRGRPWGRLHLLPENEPDDVDRLAVDRAAAAVALVLHSEQYQSHLADHERGALMSDIWEGRFASTQEIVRRARRLGADFEGRALYAIVVEPANLTEVVSSDLAEAERRSIRAALVQETREAFGAAKITALSAPVGDRILGVVGLSTADLEPLRKAAQDLCERIVHRLPNLVLVVGLSERVNGDSLRTAIAQANEAAAHGVRDAKRSGVYAFEELGVYHLLLRLAEGPELAHFVEAQLKPLLDHDARRGSPLLPTLRAFLQNGGRKAETARSLHLERRSLYYRLERIEGLLGQSLDDPDTRIQLDIALRGLAVLRKRGGRE